MPDIQKAKCFEFTVQILPPLEALGGGGQTNILPLRLSTFIFANTPMDCLYICIENEMKSHTNPLPVVTL